MNASPAPFTHPNLRRLRGSRSTPPAAERCHVCRSSIGTGHRHLLEIETGRLLCSCRACWFLFDDRNPGRASVGGAQPAIGTLRAVPDRVAVISDVRATAALWDALEIPIGLVFFRFSSATGRAAAFYPSPAGAIESQLPLDAWDAIVDANPQLGRVRPDVEALLVREAHGRRAWYIVPIDACYELIGRIRRRWQGFGGGDAVHDEIDRFFAVLNGKSSARNDGESDHGL